MCNNSKYILLTTHSIMSNFDNISNLKPSSIVIATYKYYPYTIQFIY